MNGQRILAFHRTLRSTVPLIGQATSINGAPVTTVRVQQTRTSGTITNFPATILLRGVSDENGVYGE